jgi:hypothetical protein
MIDNSLGLITIRGVISNDHSNVFANVIVMFLVHDVI